MPNYLVTTKIRPIRKLFIINENDFPIFFEITKLLMCEIDGLNNLIFQNIESTYCKRNKALIDIFDPDIIINYSNADNHYLSDFFNTETFDSKSKNFNLHKFGSPLFTFTGKPYLVNKDPHLIPSEVLATSTVSTSPKSLFYSFNYGYIDKQDYDRLKHLPSIFHELIINPIENEKNIKDSLFDSDNKFQNITNRIGSAYSTGRSIYSINYNENGHFENGEYLFISSSKNLEFILYFWNTRCVYDHSKLAWIPLELLEELQNAISDESIIVCPSDKEIENLKVKYPLNKYILASEYYFNGGKERWLNFEHEHYININNDEAIVSHPNDKTFSDIGFGGGYAFEIRGLPEFTYTKKHFLGELYNTRPQDKNFFPEYFTRLSNKGVSKYFSHFSPYATSGITQSFRLPSFNELITKHFIYYEMRLKATSKTFILEQLVKLTKGIEGFHIICEEKIFNLLISLTPRIRTENLIRKTLPEIYKTANEDEIISHIGKLKDAGEIITPSTVLSMENIFSRLNIKSDEFSSYFSRFQSLYENKIILRGKHFKCEHCTARIWLPLEHIERINYCNECGNSINVPIFVNDKVQGDHYKLNKLISRAVDQGQLSTLLLLNYLKKQQYRNFNYIANYEIYRDNILISDIDLCVAIGDKIGICECKSNSGFNDKQIIELINTAKIIECHFIILSCLLDADDEKLKACVEIISSIDMEIPIFILTRKELFNESHQNIYKHFEVDFRTNKFPRGPIVIGG